MRIVLIGNYPPDGQESMERFAQMLHAGFQEAGLTAEIWRPKAFFGARSKSTLADLGKWLGYLDKWLLYPVLLRWRLARVATSTRFHVCDHSNAPYLAHLPPARTSITCHDVLAIRGALGYADAHCPASSMGKLLQKWVLANLSRAQSLASVSQFTLDQLLALAPRRAAQPRAWRVIHNAFNAPFKPLDSSQAQPLLAAAGLRSGVPFLLHVGSGLPRKNRGLLLEMLQALGSQWDGVVCFAGEALDAALQAQIATLGLTARVVSVVKPDHSTLLALYSTCEAFVFPSFSEGFGWPVIEAQACGAPVIASRIAPMPEVGGEAALYADPTKPAQFAQALLSLQNPARRAAAVRQGFQNTARFEPAHMINAYLDLYGQPQPLAYAS